MGKFYITTPIYYVNDKPHIGHAYTTIAADVLARYHRGQGDEVLFLTGTDEHGDKVAEAAQEKKIAVEQFVDQRSASFREAFERLNISFDIFMRTTEDFHRQSVEIFMSKLNAAGALRRGVYEGLYCRGCEDFYTEKDLIDGLCPVHKRKPEVVQEQNWFFKLTDYIERVRQLIESNEMKVEPPQRRTEILSMIDQGLNDFSVTRQRVKWGIDLPFDAGQKIYVWVEALQNYISAIGYGRDAAQYTKWWPADIHFMAKDILKFHAVYWPAMLLAAGEPTPKKIFAHGFFTLDGQKMSKSLSNVIDPNDLVERYGADATRYLLLAQFPFGQDGDIKRESFDEQYNAGLANGLGNLVARVSRMVEQYLEGKVDRSAAVPPAFQELIEKMRQEIEILHLNGAVRTMQQAFTALDNAIDQAKPWQLAKGGDQDALKTALSEYVQCLLVLAPLIEPFMPETGARIHEQLSAERIIKGENLFPRL